jgi:hypothetical protein
MLTSGVTVGLTVIVIGFDMAVGELVQPNEEVITQETTSELARPELEYEGPIPAFTPFTSHWYDGFPPKVGEGVNVTMVPEQILFVEGAMETLGVTAFTTFIVNGLEVTVVVETHCAVEDISVATTSPLFNAVEVKEGPVAVFTALILHWYVGFPPFTGVGVKVTGVPGHIDVLEATMVTEGVTVGFTTIVIGLEVAVGVLAHPIVEVITHETTSALAKNEFV